MFKATCEAEGSEEISIREGSVSSLALSMGKTQLSASSSSSAVNRRAGESRDAEERICRTLFIEEGGSVPRDESEGAAVGRIARAACAAAFLP